LQLDDLTPGSHRFSAWAAYPWGEAVTAPGGSIQGRLHLWQRLNATQPAPDAPWVVPVPPANEENQQPLMLDWLIWNAPLQNLRDGDGRWRIRISVDGDSFLTDHQEAIWLKGTGSNGTTLQLELLDGQGEPLQPVFNNRLIRLEAGRRDRPVWLKARLSEDELERLSGTPRQERIDPEPSLQRSPAEEEQNDDQEAQEQAQQADVASEPVVATAQEPTTEPELATVDDSTEEAVDEAIDDDDDPTPPMDPAPAPQQLEPDPAPVRQPEPLLRPESSLGGSARELLNPDGRLKQP
jgi:hypothetical protein